MKWKRTILILAGGLVITVPLIGYLYTERYGYLYVSVWNQDKTQKVDNRPDIKIEFTDVKGIPLAIGESSETYGTIDIKNVDGTYCKPELGSTAWQRCHRANSLWLKGWIDQLSEITVHLDTCDPQTSKAVLNKRRFNIFTWWVPHPHLGGSPYTYYNLRLAVNGDNCVVKVS